MKRMKQQLLFVMALLMGVGGVSSCHPGKTDTPKESTTQDSHHQINVEETSDLLLEQSATEYKILLPSTLSPDLTLARDELLRFFQEATGVILSTTIDAGKVFDPNDRYISLGENEYFTSAGLQLDHRSLGRDGVRIQTKGKSIFIAGGSDVASLYGVYDFLNYTFHFEAYSPNCYVVDHGVKDIPLMNFDVTDIPDVPYRERAGVAVSTTSDRDDLMFGYRLREMDSDNDLLLPIYLSDNATGTWSANHNSFYFFPVEKYGKSDPEFYSPDGTQLCYLARGNEEKFDRMTSLAAIKVEQSLAAHPYAEYPSYRAALLGMNDTPYLCNCDVCKKFAAEHHGSIAATILKFLNTMGKKVNDWMDLPENEPYRRPLQYMFLAYQQAITPPFTKNKDGSWDIKEDILPQDGVVICPFVAFMNFDYGKDFYANVNQEARETLESWGKYYPQAYAWTYGGFFNDFMGFYDVYNFYQDYHAFLKQNGYSFTFSQVHSDQRGADTGFFGLARYIIGKKEWNASLNVQELIDSYFQAMYREAAEPMQRMFETCRLWFARTSVEEGWSQSAIQLSVTSNRKYWSIGQVRQWLNDLQEAYEKIAVYAKDEELYRKLKSRIDVEYLFPAKIVISCFQDSFPVTEYQTIKDNFKRIAMESGIQKIREFTSINSFLESL